MRSIKGFDVPEMQGALVPAAHEHPSRLRNRAREHRRARLEDVEALALLRRPDAAGAVTGGGDGAPAVGAEGAGVDVRAVLAGPLLLPRPRVPHPHRLVRARGHEQRERGAHVGVEHAVLVPDQRHLLAEGVDAPELRGGVYAACDEAHPVAAPPQRPDAQLVVPDLLAAHPAPRLQHLVDLKHPNEAVVAPAHEGLALVRVEPDHTRDTGRAAPQQQLGLVQVPHLKVAVLGAGDAVRAVLAQRYAAHDVGHVRVVWLAHLLRLLRDQHGVLSLPHLRILLLRPRHRGALGLFDLDVGVDGVQVPHLGELVLARGHQPRAVERHRGAVDDL
mmetsp:Transcript_49131/g.116667  ORF Transcript_49131/g.116667 Transcript_49131/m.116667 type:complete len:332 (-) Transcript_49131:839-1834(-)